MSDVNARQRSQRGATTAEYVGIVSLAAILVVGLFLLAPDVGRQAKSQVRQAYCYIATGAGFESGCGPEDNPFYEPDECTVSTDTAGAGGSVTIVVVEVGADGEYQIAQVNYIGEDGSIKTKYVVTQKIEGHVNGEFEIGGGVESSAGNASASGGFTVGVQGAAGESFTFDSLQDAQDHVSDWQDSMDIWPGDDYDPPDPTTTFYEGGVNAGISGSAPGAEGSVGGSAVLGYTQHHDTGNSTVSFTVGLEAAGSLGIPLPENIIALQASADASAQVGLNATFDEQGNLVQVQGTILANIDPDAQIGLDDHLTGAAAEDAGGTLTDLQLPDVDLDPNLPGVQAQVTFTTNFENNPGATEAIGNFLSGQDLTPEQQQALYDQINEHSQITADFSTYETNSDEYGGEIQLGPVQVGGEVHFTSSSTDLLGSYYYDPPTNTWVSNPVCQT